MKLKRRIIFILIVVSQSCSNKHIISKDNQWLYGKTYFAITKTVIDPELGGPDFVNFVSKDIVELKNGDILSKVNLSFVENKIVLYNDNTKRKITFGIINENCLVDSNNVKWKSIN